jgi:hypothetical protein
VALFAASHLYAPFGHILTAQRSYFGVYRVSNSLDGRFRQFYHGGILHGTQSLDPAMGRQPLSYFTRTGPAGAIFAAAQRKMPQGDWAIIGLGAGAMACYLESGQTLTYYEIDPLVARIAKDPRYFTYLQQCAPSSRIVLGDARLKLHEARDGQYGLIVIDAFSGDTIPMHLLTREALDLYLRKLRPGGLIAFHISNYYFDLAPVVGRLAREAHLYAWIGSDEQVPLAEKQMGKDSSTWVVVAAEPDGVETGHLPAGANFHWERLAAGPNAPLWTDDYSNLLGVMKSFFKVR